MRFIIEKSTGFFLKREFLPRLIFIFNLVLKVKNKLC